jgi:cobalamin biosynthesis protein CobT
MSRTSARVQIFESSIEKLARILSRQWGIRVVFQHGKCETEGKTIFLPVVPDNAPDDLLMAMHGHLDHEVAHILDTDFEVINKIKRREKKLFTAVNTLEDPRVEHRYVDRWPGARWNLRNSLEWSLKRVSEKQQSRDPKNPKGYKMERPWDGLSELGKVLYASTVYAQVGFDESHWFLKDVVEPEAMVRAKACEDILRRAVTAPTTAEIVELAREFLKQLNEVEEPLQQVAPEDIKDDDILIPPQPAQDHVMYKKPEPEPGQPRVIEMEPQDEEEEQDPNQPPLQGRGPSKSEPQAPKEGGKDKADVDGTPGASEGEDEEDSQGAGLSSPSESKQAAKKAAKNKSAAGAGAAQNALEDEAEPVEGEEDEDTEGVMAKGQSGPEPKTRTPPQMPRKKLKVVEATDKQLEQDMELMNTASMIEQAAKSTLRGTDKYLVYTTEGDMIEVIEGGDRKEYQTFMKKAISHVAVMKHKLMRVLLSTAAAQWEVDKLRGKVNPRVCHRVALGTSKRIFRQRVEGEKLDTVVELMVDHSGSMNDNKLTLAAQTAIILGEICHQLGIPFSVVGFSTDGGDDGDTRFENATQEEKELYSRWDNMWIGMYKDFDDAWPTAAPRVIQMVEHRHYNTYDGESLRWGAQRLLARKEKRKILFWLNDGQPCPTSADNHEAATEYTALCAKEVDQLVEVVAVGIMTDAVKQFFKNWVRVNSIADLPKVCLRQLDTLLRDGMKRDKKAKRA